METLTPDTQEWQNPTPEVAHALVREDIVYNDGDKGVHLLRSSLNGAGNKILEPNSILPGMGFHFESTPESITVGVPSVETLNTYVAQLGNEDRKFVRFEGEVVPGDEYLHMISRGEIPVATDPLLKLHDSIRHVPCWVMLPKRGMDISKAIAAEALQSGDEVTKDRVIEDLDATIIVNISEGKLRHLYGKKHGRIAAAILAHKDMKQVRAAEAHFRDAEPPVTVTNGGELLDS